MEGNFSGVFWLETMSVKVSRIDDSGGWVAAWSRIQRSILSDCRPTRLPPTDTDCLKETAMFIIMILEVVREFTDIKLDCLYGTMAKPAKQSTVIVNIHKQVELKYKTTALF